MTESTNNAAQESQAQPWKRVWPPAATRSTTSRDHAAAEDISVEELTNQRAFGSHASNTKGKIVHITKSESESESEFGNTG
ncbi:hypothetical protein B0T25DRAFT_562153 [Lasiosphaeria hispida]|uniref:Uncharacterized protein n=1 Tax=Lasiosphaeria hispida TaxID=260671 RepID=A0AAJ0HUG9_9PEZI|nr:hypothetical protein B0T25DRAFT_562153 [Lasiosphaeria hispida]